MSLTFPGSIAQCLNNNMMSYLKTAEKQRGLSITEFSKLASLYRPIRVILMDKRRHLIGREDHLDQLWVPHYLGRRLSWKSRPNSLVACLYTTRKFPDYTNWIKKVMIHRSKDVLFFHLTLWATSTFLICLISWLNHSYWEWNAC